ncbi:TIGR02452 family protein [Endozoicomonas sp. GU-1]|uniref:TIGR02452 family protein n=1 Tax=Endozoicomonas sp. GU-1 TaxID=3009078 RepID=UPI0022B37E71|nr:TIGR02452 family protein [Endozoicomonas sp. GU-1]WBA80190.1 TIGR02452 family protein [Endozoicomonas sp. GU-1]WBA87765.1 TIGR02452 family protein [Endozoicomonas sp. GU-1]
MPPVTSQPAVKVPQSCRSKQQKLRAAGAFASSAKGLSGRSGKPISTRTVASSPKRCAMNPEQAKFREIATNTVDILNDQAFRLHGKTIDLKTIIDRCIDNTLFYAPNDAITLQPRADFFFPDTNIQVIRETSLAACHRLVREEGKDHVACLNFASAVEPGGMFREGTNTQEDSLARASALFASLDSDTGKQMYAYNNQYQYTNRGLYSDTILYSPDVPVFKDDNGNPEEPYLVSFITAAAVDLPYCKGIQQKTLQQTMYTRARKILAVAANNGVKHLILGAWGCGIFGHDAADIARLFASLLAEDDFKERFVSVSFPITDPQMLRVFEGHLS